MFSCRKHWGFCQGDTLVYIVVTVQSAKCKAQGFKGVWGHAPHPLPSPRKFWEKCTLRLNLMAVFAHYLIKLNIATELKTSWSIDDRLKILKGGTGPLP